MGYKLSVPDNGQKPSWLCRFELSYVVDFSSRPVDWDSTGDTVSNKVCQRLLSTKLLGRFPRHLNLKIMLRTRRGEAADG